MWFMKFSACAKNLFFDEFLVRKILREKNYQSLVLIMPEKCELVHWDWTGLYVTEGTAIQARFTT